MCNELVVCHTTIHSPPVSLAVDHHAPHLVSTASRYPSPRCVRVLEDPGPFECLPRSRIALLHVLPFCITPLLIPHPSVSAHDLNPAWLWLAFNDRLVSCCPRYSLAHHLLLSASPTPAVGSRYLAMDRRVWYLLPNLSIPQPRSSPSCWIPYILGPTSRLTYSG